MQSFLRGVENPVNYTCRNQSAKPHYLTPQPMYPSHFQRMKALRYRRNEFRVLSILALLAFVGILLVMQNDGELVQAGLLK